MAGKQKIDDWYKVGRELEQRMKRARHGERKKIYEEFQQSTGLRKLYLRRIFTAAEAITFIARFDPETASKMKSVSLRAAIAVERWLHYSQADALVAAIDLVAGELSVLQLERREKEARTAFEAAVAQGFGKERPEERSYRFELIATDYVRQKIRDRKLSWVAHDISLLDDPMGENALPDCLAFLRAKPFFDQVWSGGNSTRPLAVAFYHTDAPTAEDRQRFQKTVLAFCGLQHVGVDRLLICNQLPLVEAGRRILAAAQITEAIEIVHLNLPAMG